jgi:hypothetical protein
MGIILLSNLDCNLNGSLCNDQQQVIDPENTAQILGVPYFNGFYTHITFYF